MGANRVQRDLAGIASGRAGAGGTSRVRVTLAVVGFTMAVACGAGGPSSRSSVVLIVERISAAADEPAGDANRTFVESDVLTGGSVVQDTAQVTLRLVARDSSVATSPTAATATRFATIERYRVRYARSDGRNVPGVDVPHPWDGALTLTTSFDGQKGEFVLVRASAKLEPPLVTLRDGGGDVVINTLAYVTFHGRDHGGARIEATGAITIQFADWSDATPAAR